MPIASRFGGNSLRAFGQRGATILKDLYFKYVTLLLSTTSLNNATNSTFVDSSSNNLTVTRNGNPTQGSYSPFGSNWSNYFNGGTDRLQVPVTSNMYLGTTYTIEAWAYYNSASYGARPIFNQMEPFQGGFAGLSVTLNTSGQLVAEYRPATSGAVTTITGPTVTPYTWFHIALVSDNSTAKLYVNGTQVGSTTTFGDYPSAKTNTVAVGSWGSGWNDGGIPAAAWIGYISNLRVVKGTAVYTANFTPPTSPLTAISGTVLLTCQNNRFIDNSSVNNTLTPVTTVSVQPFSPFAPTTSYNTSTRAGSGYFDGDGDNLTLADNALFEFGSGEFSIDCWVYITSLKGYQAFVSKNTGTDYYGYNLYLESNNTYGFIAGNGSWTIALNAGTVPSAGQWHHLAITRQSNQWRLFLNGNLNATTNNSFSIPDLACPLYVGKYPAFPSYSSTKDLSGYMSELRIVKGGVPSLFSTSSTTTGTQIFTPPTAPYTGSESLTAGSVSLLMHYTNAGVYDASGFNDLETVGDAKVSTVQSKFGGTSMYFDGTGDYLAIPSGPQFYFGTGDFTVEAWIYPTGGTGNRHIFSGNITNAMGFYINSSGKIAVAKSGVVEVIASTTTISTSTFTHVAATRSGNTFRIFVNGTLEATVTSSQDFTSFGDNRVGYESGSSYYQGYIDDLRVTKGVVRYTGNFSPPAKTLPLF